MLDTISKLNPSIKYDLSSAELSLLIKILKKLFRALSTPEPSFRKDLVKGQYRVFAQFRRLWSLQLIEISEGNKYFQSISVYYHSHRKYDDSKQNTGLMMGFIGSYKYEIETFNFIL